MSSDARAVRDFFQTRIPDTLFRRQTSKRAFEDSRFHLSHKPLSANMGRAPTPAAKMNAPVKIRAEMRASAADGRERMEPMAVRVSVNLRYSRRSTPLLPFDVFVAAPASATLADVYKRASERDPDGSMAPYTLRADKGVYVLSADPRSSAAANAADDCASIAATRPVRLIFCVKDKAPAPPARTEVKLVVNARVGMGKDLLAEDVEIDAPFAWKVSDVWRRLRGALPALRRHRANALSARRPVDGVALRIALVEMVADVADIGATRYIFELATPPDAEVETGKREKKAGKISRREPQIDLHEASDSDFDDGDDAERFVDDALSVEVMESEYSVTESEGEDIEEEDAYSFVNTMPSARLSNRARIHGKAHRK